MIKIIIAGCGQIGSRHLQALSELQESAKIYLIDPSIESILIAEQRFNDALNDSKNPCKFSLIRSKFNCLLFCKAIVCQIHDAIIGLLYY